VDEADIQAAGGRDVVPEGAPAAPSSATRRAGLFLLAFASGFAVLTIELTGARLIAPVFGLSAVPWTAVIGVILTALGAVGLGVLGAAALSLPVAFQEWRPDMRVDVVEIDPAVTDNACAHFSYGKAQYPNIHVTHDDARIFLRKTDRRWDAIDLDVFDHLLTVPWTMVTVETLTKAADRLEPGGLLVANVLSPLSGPGVGFLQRFRATLEEVFPALRVHATDPGRDPAAIQNLIVVAASDPTALPDIDWPRAAPGPVGRPLSDAWAPVEYLQGGLFLGGVRWN